mmetsp:Transcript_7118/g.16276  ORF Transcript_7118/g.16276 Transcript_7118/m.16276 type:complete len:305 (+) Transcript_7118:332-1246(+)
MAQTLRPEEMVEHIVGPREEDEIFIDPKLFLHAISADKEYQEEICRVFCKKFEGEIALYDTFIDHVIPATTTILNREIIGANFLIADYLGVKRPGEVKKRRKLLHICTLEAFNLRRERIMSNVKSIVLSCLSAVVALVWAQMPRHLPYNFVESGQWKAAIATHYYMSLVVLDMVLISTLGCILGASLAFAGLKVCENMLGSIRFRSRTCERLMVACSGAAGGAAGVYSGYFLREYHFTYLTAVATAIALQTSRGPLSKPKPSKPDCLSWSESIFQSVHYCTFEGPLPFLLLWVWGAYYHYREMM